MDDTAEMAHAQQLLGPVVVVGASGALGRRFAMALARRGEVHLVVREPGKVPYDLTYLPTWRADICDRRALDAAFAGITAHSGPVHGVINAAGVVAFGPFGALDAATVETLFATNATGVVHLLDTAGAHIAAGGWFVQLSGVAAELPVVGMGAYCASKAAASAAMRVAARELRRRDIRAIDVRVGHTETGLATRALGGTAPRFGIGHDPDAVVARVLEAIDAGATDLPPDAFTDAGSA